MTLTRMAALLLSLIFPQAAAAEVALVYDGPGICDGCAQDAAAAVRLAGLTVFMAGPAALNPDRLGKVDLVVVGGAEDTVEIRRGMTKAQFRALREYVRGGGHYLGLCAGAYLAGDVLNDEGRVAGLRLFDGDAYPASPYAARVEPVTWRGKVVPFYTQEAAGFSSVPTFRTRSSPPMPMAHRPRSSRAPAGVQSRSADRTRRRRRTAGGRWLASCRTAKPEAGSRTHRDADGSALTGAAACGGNSPPSFKGGHIISTMPQQALT